MTNFPSLDEVIRKAGLQPSDVQPRAPWVVKLPLEAAQRPVKGKLVLVSAINPTKHGEGKTTVSIGLTDGLRKIGVSAIGALRQPSMGPVFGVKGGGAGGGEASLTPLEEVNLGLSGDFDAIAAAHNTLAALAENASHFRLLPGWEARGLTFRRVLDVNDRSLRRTVVGLTQGEAAREAGFDITAASEVMAVLGLSRDRKDLRARLSHIRVGRRTDGSVVTAADVNAVGSMMVLLRHALFPNLVSTKHGSPVVVHGGPFGNIAHGTSSILGTRMALGLGDVVVTEAGFGFDLGGEKFLDIVCRTAGFWPHAVVLVVTLKALKAHGGADNVSEPNLAALEKGLPLLLHHLKRAREFGLSPVVALNVFPQDVEEEVAWLQKTVSQGVAPIARITAYRDGPQGAMVLANTVVEALKTPAPTPRYVYAAEAPVEEKILAVAKTYGATEVDYSAEAKKTLAQLKQEGGNRFLVCMAKTPMSLTADANVRGIPAPFRLPVREIRISAGAGFVVPLCGDLETMPGLGRQPAAFQIDLDDETGAIRGLY